MAKYYNHIKNRDIVHWTSFGKHGNEPVRETLVKDLSDIHLERIIDHIKERDPENLTGSMGEFSILWLMEQELDYRKTVLGKMIYGRNKTVFNEETYGLDDPE